MEGSSIVQSRNAIAIKTFRGEDYRRGFIPSRLHWEPHLLMKVKCELQSERELKIRRYRV